MAQEVPVRSPNLRRTSRAECMSRVHRPRISSCRHPRDIQPTRSMRSAVFLVWAAIGIQLAGCGGYGSHPSQTNHLHADQDIRSGNSRLADDIENEVRIALSPCWSIDPAAPKTRVMIELTMRSDGTVSEALVSDPDRYGTDQAYRYAADRALRAVTNPSCQPLPFPNETWPTWRELILVFDSAEFFRRTAPSDRDASG